MPAAVRYLAVLVVPIVLSRLVETLLATRWGQPVVRGTLGPKAVETEQGREVIGRYTKVIAALVITAVNRWQDQAGGEPLSRRLRRVGGLGWLRYLSEVLLGLGTLFRTTTEFFEDARDARSGRPVSTRVR